MKVAVDSSPAPSLRRQEGPTEFHNPAARPALADEPERRSAAAFFLLPSSFSGWRLHLAILAAVVVVTTGTRWALRQRQAEEYRRLGQAATDARAREIEAYWKTFHYTDASGPDFPEKFLGTIRWPALGLSGVQQEQLQVRLRQVLAYLQHPTVQAYWQLRTTGLHYQFQPTRTVHWLWTNRLHRSVADLSADPRPTVTALWTMAAGTSNQLALSSLRAVCLTNVAAGSSISNTVSSLVHGPAHKGFTALRAALNPGFAYTGAGGSSLAESNAPVYVHLSFFARLNASERAGPVYLSLAWLPTDQAWAPGRLLSDTWLTLYTPF